MAEHVWDHTTMTAVRAMRARAVIGQRELDDRHADVDAWTTDRLAEQLRQMCATYAVEIDTADLEVHRAEDVVIGGELWVMSWRPQTQLLRLAGGEPDGFELTHPTFPNPLLVQLVVGTAQTAAESESSKLLFELAGWSEPDHLWIYDLVDPAPS